MSHSTTRYRIGDVIEHAGREFVCVSIWWHEIAKRICVTFLPVDKRHRTSGFSFNARTAARTPVKRQRHFRVAARACERKADDYLARAHRARHREAESIWRRRASQWRHRSDRFKRLSRA